jgi:hypothetical protein
VTLFEAALKKCQENFSTFSTGQSRAYGYNVARLVAAAATET